MQFLIWFRFAIFIIKSQRQTLYVVKLRLEDDCVSHRQLYGDCFRVGSPNNPFIYALFGKATTVEYTEVLG